MGLECLPGCTLAPEYYLEKSLLPFLLYTFRKSRLLSLSSPCVTPPPPTTAMAAADTAKTSQRRERDKSSGLVRLGVLSCTRHGVC